jgi:hypothetical protein
MALNAYFQMTPATRRWLCLWLDTVAIDAVISPKTSLERVSEIQRFRASFWKDSSVTETLNSDAQQQGKNESLKERSFM